MAPINLDPRKQLHAVCQTLAGAAKVPLSQWGPKTWMYLHDRPFAKSSLPYIACEGFLTLAAGFGDNIWLLAGAATGVAMNIIAFATCDGDNKPDKTEAEKTRTYWCEQGVLCGTLVAGGLYFTSGVIGHHGGQVVSDMFVGSMVGSGALTGMFDEPQKPTDYKDVVQHVASGRMLQQVVHGQLAESVEPIASLHTYKKAALFWGASAGALVVGYMQTANPWYIPAAAFGMLGTYLVAVSKKTDPHAPVQQAEIITPQLPAPPKPADQDQSPQP